MTSSITSQNQEFQKKLDNTQSSSGYVELCGRILSSHSEWERTRRDEWILSRDSGRPSLRDLVGQMPVYWHRSLVDSDIEITNGKVLQLLGRYVLGGAEIPIGCKVEIFKGIVKGVVSRYWKQVFTPATMSEMLVATNLAKDTNFLADFAECLMCYRGLRSAALECIVSHLRAVDTTPHLNLREMLAVALAELGRSEEAAEAARLLAESKPGAYAKIMEKCGDVSTAVEYYLKDFTGGSRYEVQALHKQGKIPKDRMLDHVERLMLASAEEAVLANTRRVQREPSLVCEIEFGYKNYHYLPEAWLFEARESTSDEHWPLVRKVNLYRMAELIARRWPARGDLVAWCRATAVKTHTYEASEELALLQSIKSSPECEAIMKDFSSYFFGIFSLGWKHNHAEILGPLNQEAKHNDLVIAAISAGLTGDPNKGRY